MTNPNNLKNLLRDYYKELDRALEVLSHGEEGRLSALPGYALATRHIHFGITQDGRGVVVRVTSDPELDADQVSYRCLDSAPDITDAAAPFGIVRRADGSVAVISGTTAVEHGHLHALSQGGHPLEPRELATWPFMMMGDAALYNRNPLSPPMIAPSPFLGFGKTEEAIHNFTQEAAKTKAIEVWNATLTDSPGPSFVQTARAIFATLRAIAKRKAFLERRIHRFLNAHRTLLLPSFACCFSEVPLHHGEETFRADFILERDAGTPALLVELESPHHRVFRLDGHLTAEANHAVSQITDWVRAIDSDAARNASGNMSFLSGPKDRLVVIGRGTEQRARLIESKFSGTTIWTYDLLLEQARARWNNHIAEQHRLLGLDEIRPF